MNGLQRSPGRHRDAARPEPAARFVLAALFISVSTMASTARAEPKPCPPQPAQNLTPPTGTVQSAQNLTPPSDTPRIASNDAVGCK